MRLLNASGCLDALAAPEAARTLDAYVTKTVTPLPREGNAPVRIAETDVGMLNAIGLPNPGIDAFVAEHLPRLAALGVPLWVSVGGFSAADYVHVAKRIDDEAIDALELNLSCPNVDEVPENVADVVAAVRAVTAKPLYAKLSAAVADLGATARAAEAAGADGLSLVNTVRGLALDERTLRPVLARGAGGLSGPALRPVALAAVHTCFRETRLPLVGMGGVSTGRHALELLAAGATDVAVGTALFSDPAAAARIRLELKAELATLGFASPDNAVGAAHVPEEATLDPGSRVRPRKSLHIGANMTG
ncbi:MAG: dihydroorotate dehydrogenase catalytic subunit [Gaiellaceae bacterium]|nr:dihydroorotate dehydrogenase catalytic subunit [Gaiellaceae bacterium]